jgi:hypothetical protein
MLSRTSFSDVEGSSSRSAAGAVDMSDDLNMPKSHPELRLIGRNTFRTEPTKIRSFPSRLQLVILRRGGEATFSMLRMPKWLSSIGDSEVVMYG